MDRVFCSPKQIDLSTGIRMEYHHHGNVHSSHKVLFIMGLWTTKEFWLKMLASFEQSQYHIVTFDNRGVGGSDSPFQRYTTQLMANDTVSLLNHLGWDKAHVVGFSLGGMIALELASLEPSRVCSLSLLATSYSWRSVCYHGMSRIRSLWKAKWIDLMYPPAYLATHRSQLDRFYTQLNTYGMPTALGALGQIAAACSHHIGRERLAELRATGVPILIVAAKQDKVIDSANAEALYEYLSSPSTKLVSIPDAGHGLVIQCSDLIAKELLNTFSTNVL